MGIAMLIGIMIAIVVAINLIPVITSNTAQISTATGYSSSIVSLVNILPIIFIAVIILGVVSFLGFNSNHSMSSSQETTTKNKNDFILRIKKRSEELEQYINNLDAYLEIRTINHSAIEGLKLYTYTTNPAELAINDGDYDWYLVEKNHELPAFKVVGLHKQDAEKNVVYILGKNTETDKPYLIELMKDYVEKTVKKWTEDNVESKITSAVIETIGFTTASPVVDSITQKYRPTLEEAQRGIISKESDKYGKRKVIKRTSKRLNRQTTHLYGV